MSKRRQTRAGLGIALAMIATSVVMFAAPAVTPPAAAAPVDQCARPLSHRVGGWACDELVVRVSAPQAFGTCTFSGCWDMVDTVTSTYIGHGFYGYGGVSLGTSHLAFTVRIRGFRTVSRPLFAYTSRGTRNSVLTAERLYMSDSFRGGNGVNGGASRQTSPCGPRVGSQNCTWAGVGGAGYGSFEDTAKHISIVHELTWTDHEFPGRWHMFAKSLIMNWSAGGYHVDSRRLTPAVSAEGGWTPV